MNPLASQMAVTEDGRRTRTTSGPQKSSQITYNDTLQQQQHHNGMASSASSQSFRSGYGLPAGAMSPVTSSHPALQQANINSAANGYHPYRRAQKGTETNSHVYSNQVLAGSMTPSQGIPQPAVPAVAAAPMFNPRMRSTSTSSSIASIGATGKPASSPLSYTPTPSNQTRNHQVNSQQQAGLGHLRNSPQLRPTIPATASRPETMNRMNGSDRAYSSAMPPPPPPIASSRPPHSRSNSGSSSQSATEGSYISSHSASSSGRNTPNSSAKKPSPLSRAAAATHDDNDGDNGAVYGGSDDEDTIRGRSTPTPDDKTRKGLSSKLKKALSFSTLSDIQQAEAAAAAPDRAYGGRNNIGNKRFEGNSAETNGSSGSTRSTSPPQTPDNGAPPMHNIASSAASISSRRSMRPPISNSDGMGGKRGLFNRKFNSSTDNISISSTVSSASVMLRKVGNLGKLARRSSLMGLTNMFNKDKDKDAGKDGFQKDSFGAHTSPESIVAADDAALGANGKKEKLKPRKGMPASASVSHATVELESSGGALNDKSMTPAASYVRQHQLQMKQQAEAERVAREKEEAERVALQRSNNTNKTTDDVTESRQRMIEKEKERLKSKRGWKKKFSMGSVSEAKQATGLETMPVVGGMSEEASNGYQQDGSQYDSDRKIGQISSSAAYLDKSADNSFESDDLMPPQMPGAMEGGYESSGDEFETDSLRHWGEGIERSRESAAKIKQVKGILKNTQMRMSERSTSGHSSPPLSNSANSIDRPFTHRNRANSYDAPQGSTHPGGSVPPMSQMSTTPAGSDRVDGVARVISSEGNTSQDHRSTTASNASSTSAANNSSQFSHHANSSMPTLSLVMNPSNPNRSMTGTASRKQLVFADTQIYHSTWPAHIYDRRGELATCNCLTPLLAQRIKEELNTYKMEEMAVAPSSRIHTHFFV